MHEARSTGQKQEEALPYNQVSVRHMGIPLTAYHLHHLVPCNAGPNDVSREIAVPSGAKPGAMPQIL